MAKKNKKKKRNNSLGIILLLGLICIFAIYFISSDLEKKSGEKEDSLRIVTENEVEKKTVLNAIEEAIAKFEVPENLCDVKHKEDAIYFYVGINSREVDLNFVNMVLKGRVESAGGKLLKGVENNSATRQKLIFYDPQEKQKYVVKLYYASRKSYANKKPQISIVIDDFGYFGGKLLEDFCKTDENVTFAILPFLPHSQEVMKKASKYGHETIIHAPMEPISYPKNDPGDGAIFVHLSENQIRKRIKRFIKALPECKGMNNHMGSMATSDKTVMTVVMQTLKEYDLFFVDSFTSGSSVAYKVANQVGIPTFKRDIFLDAPDSSEETLNKKINELKKMKGSREKVLVISHCLDRDRLVLLEKFIKKAKEIGFEIVPVSKLFENELPEII